MGSRSKPHAAQRLPIRSRNLAFKAAVLAFGMAFMLATDTLGQEKPHTSLLPLLQKYCVDCHAGEDASAKIDLEKMSADPSFATGFQEWRRAARALDEGKMPPPKELQPTAEERRRIAAAIRAGLHDIARQRANDPGETVIRRLSSAEYAYTLEDLTGVDLDLDKDFVSDAFGGEGFTNVGNVQFIEDSTLERYLDAAKTVASHAVIGAGGLYFYRDAGLNGREFSAVERIQQIYERYGFRARAGELTPPYGMDCYPKSFYAAWRYRYRQQLGIADATLAQLAAEEKVQPRFLEHIWSVLNDPTLLHPTKEIVDRWRAIRGPGENAADFEQTARKGIDDLIQYMQTWYELLSTNSVERETGTVFTNEPLEIEASQPYVARFSPGRRGGGDRTVQFLLTVLPVSNSNENTVVIWRKPIIYFETLEGDEPAPLTLKQHLSEEVRKTLKFGENPGGMAIGPDDFVMKVGETRTFTVTHTQKNSGTMDLIVETVLDPILGKDCVVRCDISSARVPGRQRMYSALIGDKNGKGLPRFREEVTRFAEAFPEISHREPARADRDPIPLMYGGNLWNNADRNFFHTSLKYYRGDKFLVEKILDEPTKRALDDAWTDLLTSFDHHDLHLRFAAKKFHVDLQGTTIANVLPEQIDKLPTGNLRDVVKEVRNRPVSERMRDIELGDVRGFIREQVAEYQAMQARLRAARPRHVDDVLEFAGRAWRRPLTADEQARLRAFYTAQLEETSANDHPRAIRAMITRVLVSPEFLYRGEGPLPSQLPSAKRGQEAPRPATTDASMAASPLADHELATRLSYFLWSSVPDDELRRAAAAGELRDPAKLEQQARRMLRDPKIRRFATEFFGQWLGFYRFDRHRGIDSNRFPEFTDHLKQSFYDEACGFFEHLVREDRPIGEILFANYAFLNKSLTEHYGISASVSEGAPQKVETAANSHRGGLFGLAAVLATTSNPLRTSPVRRGDWVLRRVLGTPVPPPPADAGSIPADDVLGDGLTVRERLDAHRRNASCAGCHTRIDPLGFALENYDPLGRWRTVYRDGRPVDPTGILTDGTTVTGLDGLRTYLKTQESQFQRNLCVKLVGYAFGRSESLADAQLIDDMTSRLATDSRFSGLVVSIITSRQFCFRRDTSAALASSGND